MQRNLKVLVFCLWVLCVAGAAFWLAVYLAHGKVDFFGDEAMARTGGAGGQNRTGYARLFRAALYH